MGLIGLDAGLDMGFQTCLYFSVKGAIDLMYTVTDDKCMKATHSSDHVKVYEKHSFC